MPIWKIALMMSLVLVAGGCGDYSATQQRLADACNKGSATACANYQTCSQAISAWYVNPMGPGLACKDVAPAPAATQ